MQAYRPSVVFLNGAYWGIHNIREKLNEHYLASHYDVQTDEIDLLEIDGQVIHGDALHYRSMIDFMERNDLAAPDRYAQIRTAMDVDNFRDYQIVQIYLGNTDWPGANVKYWRPRSAQGRWRWLMFDADFGFGRWPHTPFTHDTLAFATAVDGPDWPNPPWATFILRSLLQNADFRRDFINRFADLLNTTLSSGRVVEAIEAMSAILAPEMPAHISRWGGTLGGWERGVGSVANFARNRPSFARRHIAARFSLEGTGRLALSIEPAGGGWLRVNSLDVTEPFWSGTYFKGMPIRLDAVAARGYRFVGWKGTGVDRDSGESLEITLAGNAVLQAEFAAAQIEIASVVINEINYHSADDFDPEDWVELYNAGNENVDMGGWFWADESDNSPFALPVGTLLPAGGYVVLCRDRAAFAALFPEAAPCIGDWDFGLSNAGEQVRLLDAEGYVVDSLAYQDAATWPVAADGQGPTLQLRDPGLDNALAANWTASEGHGTPGQPNYTPLPTAVEALEPQGGPAALTLESNFPNPFNEATQIRFSMTRAGYVDVAIFDALGRRVEVLSAAMRGVGTHEVAFEGTNRASGLYFYRVRLRGDDGRWTAEIGRMMLLR